MIFWNTFLVAIASVVVALLLPKIYRSTASLFPPEDDALLMPGGASSLAAVSALAGNGLWSSLMATPSDLYAAVLRSRAVREPVIERFGLIELYGVPDMDRALKIFDTQVQIKVGGVGLVFVSVESKDPERAASIANALVEELDRVNREKRTTSAGQARVFIETRLAESERDLAAAEEELKRLQEDTGVLIPEQQVRAVVSAVADLEVELVAKEVELGVLEAQLGPRHPDRESLAREVRTLRQKLVEMDRGPAHGSSPTDSGDESRFDIPLQEYPEISRDYLRAVRAVKVQEAIYELLRQQYEQYRIMESRDTRTVQILDPARPANVKVRPKRSILCIAATLLAFLASVALASGLEALSRTRQNRPETYARLRDIARELRLSPLFDRLTREG